MLVLHGAVGMFDEIGYVVAALAGVLAIGSFVAHFVTSRGEEAVAEPVNIER
jgi:hypothetical protein